MNYFSVFTPDDKEYAVYADSCRFSDEIVAFYDESGSLTGAFKLDCIKGFIRRECVCNGGD